MTTAPTPQTRLVSLTIAKHPDARVDPRVELMVQDVSTRESGAAILSFFRLTPGQLVALLSGSVLRLEDLAGVEE